MPVVGFAELFEAALWAVWQEKHAPYTQFLPRPARKESNVPKLKRSYGLTILNIYTVLLSIVCYVMVCSRNQRAQSYYRKKEGQVMQRPVAIGL